MSQEYGPALWIPTSHYWTGFSGQTPRWIIVHGTAGGSSAQNIAAYFQTNDPPTSTHFVVGQDGTVVQCVSEGNAAWGNGVLSAGHDPWWSDTINPNLQTFSIEHVKPALDNSTQLTAAQQAASFALIKHLCDTHGIPARPADANGGITGHYSIDPVNRSRCPGPYPWTALWSYLSSGSGAGAMAGVPSGWHDDGRTLTAPNGHKVVAGFRDFILSSTWSADDQPLEEETGLDQILHTDARWGAGTRQLFTFSGLAWAKQPDPAVASGSTILRVPTGAELQNVEGTLRWLNSQTSGLSSQVSSLTSQLTAAQAQIAQLTQQLQAAQGSGSGAGAGTGGGTSGTGSTGGTTGGTGSGTTTPPDPKAAAALAVLQQIKTVLGEI